jgi:hypothetical protein
MDAADTGMSSRFDCANDIDVESHPFVNVDGRNLQVSFRERRQQDFSLQGFPEFLQGSQLKLPSSVPETLFEHTPLPLLSASLASPGESPMKATISDAPQPVPFWQRSALPKGKFSAVSEEDKEIKEMCVTLHRRTFEFEPDSLSTEAISDQPSESSVEVELDSRSPKPNVEDPDVENPEGYTVMISNIPNWAEDEDLVEVLEEVGLGGRYSYLYIPRSYTSQRASAAMGYAIVKFVERTHAAECRRRVSGTRFRGSQNMKPLVVDPVTR